ncbi:hypothetical protein ACPV5S_15660 [Vibrio astriarenae]
MNDKIVNLAEGATATFEVKQIAGSKADDIEWFVNAISVTKGLETTYTMTDISQEDDKSVVYAVVRNERGTVQSRAATLTVIWV